MWEEILDTTKLGKKKLVLGLVSSTAFNKTANCHAEKYTHTVFKDNMKYTNMALLIK